ncbi:hypothetical protein IAT40_004123 [Kwoniella sp. CBS 6097]
MSTRATVSALRAIRPSQVRTLSTSRLALSSNSSSDLPPTPNSAEALGFKNQANRQRQLPLDLKLKIPVTSKQNIYNSEQRIQKERKRDVTFDLPPVPKSGSDTETKEDFFADSDLSASEPSKSTQQSRPTSSAPRSRRALKGVSMDVVSDSSALPPDVVRRQRLRRDKIKATGTSQGGQGQDRKGRAGGQQQQQRERKRRDVPAREKKAMQPRRQLTFETMDHSKQGLFGKRSLVNESIAAVGAALGHPRHAASVRQSVLESAFPSNPLPILSPAPAKSSEQAVQIASWLAALNGSIQSNAKSELSDTVAAQLKR